MITHSMTGDCTCRSKKHLQNTEILKAALAEEEEAEIFPDALQQSIHTATGTPQVAQTDVPDLAAANDEAWLREDAEHLVAGREAQDPPESTGTAGSMMGSPNQPMEDSSSASETSSEGQQEEDEDALLARMVQAHMQLSNSNLQKKETPAQQAGSAQDSHGMASRSSAARPSHLDAQALAQHKQTRLLGEEWMAVPLTKEKLKIQARTSNQRHMGQICKGHMQAFREELLPIRAQTV